ncbi:SusC/RagA family TonB-linked outer membrane protein [Olivibacter domesticus]|uniref:SusC/RagA family TonB-linked outer membrane protein n=1 Tax=Olivibacter domesticus TaxID=407022 RepID=UPI00138FDFD2|nr:SusC/RagA family TonB-linked outer membrane protein [Olivibacter domesticus]
MSYKSNNITLSEFFEVIDKQTDVAPFVNHEQVNLDEVIQVNFDQEPLDNVLLSILKGRGVYWGYYTDNFLIKTTTTPLGNRLVNCRRKNIRLADFFAIVYKQTGLQAFYNDELLSSDERLNVDFKDVPLDLVLSWLLSDRQLTWRYREEAETFPIIPQWPRTSDSEPLPSVMSRTVIGKVVNGAGIPLEGVGVMVKNGLKGTYTDKEGKFNLAGIPFGVRLLVRQSGFKVQELADYPDSVFVRMEELIAPLKEVRVRGFLRTLLTGSTSGIRAEEIAAQPNSNVLSALQGRIPGLFLSQTTGLPGGGFKIRLRGKNSIDSDSDPLILVDGIPYPSASFNENLLNLVGSGSGMGANVAASPLNMLSINDIASVDILKDADATAIYGSQGANGVILITSKLPQPGSNGLRVNYNAGIGRASRFISYLNTPEYLRMRHEGISNDGSMPGKGDYDLLRWDTTRYTDWQKEMIGGAAAIREASVELQGGRELAAYRVSGMFREEGTVYPSADFKYRKGGARVQVNLSSGDQRLKVAISGNFIADRNRLPQTDLTILSNTPPNTPLVYDRNGNLNFEDSTFFNPYGQLLRTYTSKSQQLGSYLKVSAEPLPNLTFRSTFGVNSVQQNDVQVNPVKAFNPASGVDSGYSYFSATQYRNWLADLQIGWKAVAGQEQFHLLMGIKFQGEGQVRKTYMGLGYGADAELSDTAAAAVVNPMLSIDNYDRFQSLYGRIEYRHANKYLVSLTGSRDGSTRLSQGRRFAYFGAVGLGWIFSREPWLRSSKLISFGKLRASIGRTGNDRYLRDYDKGTYIQAPDANLQWGMDRYGLPVYSWEKISKREVGLDVGLKEDRVMVTINYYHNRSKNQLLTLQVPAYPEDRYVPINHGAIVENKGWELDIEASLIKKDKFGWTTNVNVTLPKNRLVGFPHLDRTNYRFHYQEGMPLDMVMGFHLLGVDSKAGIYQFADAGNDGISLEDYNYGKALGPTVYGGVQHHFIYGNMELSMLFRFVRQQNYDYRFSQQPPGMMNNQPSDVLGRWQRTGDLAGWQRYTASYSSAAGLAYGQAMRSDRQISDASYIRLQSVSLSYSLPQKFMERIRIKSGKLYLQGLNLFTITGYPGRDPETTASAEVYPSLRTITAGLQISL